MSEDHEPVPGFRFPPPDVLAQIIAHRATRFNWHNEICPTCGCTQYVCICRFKKSAARGA